MNLNWLLILAILFPFSSKGQTAAQQKLVDSILIQAKQSRNAHDYVKALISSERSLEKSLTFGYVKGQSDSYVQLGRAHKGLENFEEALAAYDKAFELRLNTLRDSCGAAGVLLNMAGVLDDIFYYEGGKNYLHRAIALCQKAESLIINNANCTYLINIYTNSANIHESLGLVNEAIQLNIKALKLLSTTQDTSLRIIVEYGLAKRFIQSEKLDAAQLQLNATLTLSQEYSELDSLMLGKIYEGLGVIKLNSNLPEKALDYFNRAKNCYAKFPESVAELTYVHFNKARAYELMDEFVQAEKAYRQARILQSKESVADPFYEMLETQEVLMAFKEQNRKKDSRISHFFIALSAISITSCIIAFLLYMKSKAMNALREEHYQLRHDVMKNGLIAITNHISSDLLTLKKDHIAHGSFLKIRRMINRVLAQIGYQTSHSAIPEKLKGFVQDMHDKAIETSMQDVQNYSYLDEVEDYLLSENLRFNLEAIITEAFSNIGKHANCQTTSINFSVDDKGLSILIQDDGQGCNLDEVSRSGLNTINQRVKSLKGTIFMESSPGNGFSISINLPRFPEVP